MSVEIARWLDDRGLGKYAEAFVENDIDFDVLAELDDGELKEIGVSLGDRKRLLRAIAEDTDAGKMPAIDAVSEAAPSSYTPADLAERIVASRTGMVGERKQVTVLFADIKGSLELIESQDAEQARAILDGAVAAMMAAVHRYEGTVNKVLGDGIMALFGAPLAFEDHATRACFAGLAIQNAMDVEAEAARQRHGIELAARVGLNSGEVVVRAISNDLSVDYDAIGPTVHLAARMEQLARPGGIRLTGATAHLADGHVQLKPLGPIPVKGMSAPVEALELIGAEVGRTRMDASQGRGLTPFVGRGDEVATLDGARRLAEAGQGQTVAVVGEPGVGKSRLFREFAQSYRTRDWRVLDTYSVSSGQARAWEPVVALLKRYFEIDEEDDARRMREKILGRILALDEALKPYLPAYLNLLGGTAEDAAWIRMDAPQRRRWTLDGVKALLVRESQEQPLALVFDDMHWVDGETQALVDELVEGANACRILLLVNYRPEYRHDWGNLANYTQIRVGPLDGDISAALVDGLLGSAGGLERIKAQLIQDAEGNPLYLEEGVRHLADLGVLRGKPGAYEVVGTVDTIEVPPSIVAIIAARVDRLSPDRKAVLQAAAVIGDDVSLDLLQTVTESTPESLRAAIAELRGRELIYEARLFPEIAYAFNHGLTRQVVYDGLLQETRRELHGRVGAAMETSLGAEAAGQAERLAHHFAEGACWERAVTYLLAAAERAKRQYTYPRAAEFLDRAIAMAEREEEANSRTLAALEMIGDVAGLRGHWTGANEHYDAALAHTTASADRTRIGNKKHRQSFAYRDGVRLAYYEHGEGDQTLLLLSPLTYGLELFQPALERLCQDFHIVTMDGRGTGDSDPFERPYPLSERVADVGAVIEAVDRKAITGVGISRAGTLSLQLAHDHPGLLEKVVTIGSPVDQMEADSPVTRLDYNRRVAELLAEEDLEGLLRLLGGRVFSEPATKHLVDATVELRLATPKETLLSFFDAMDSFDIKPILSGLDLPVLVTHGTEDRQVDFAGGEFLRKVLPNGTLYPFEGYGHIPLLTATEEFCHVLRQFARDGEITEPFVPGRGG